MAVEIISRLILALSILLILVVSPCFSQGASTPQSTPQKIARSRVIAVDVADGKIRWSTDPGFGPTPAFADLDADASADLVVPGKNRFAVGLPG